MKKAALGLSLLVLLILPLSSQQRQPYALSVNVDLIVLNVRVLDKAGQSIQGLDKQAFRIEEDGKPQQISFFAGEDSPATIGLVLDSSASINSKHTEIQKAARRFIHSMHPRDQVFVLRFSERLYWMLPGELPFTDNIDLLEQSLQWTPAAGRTSLYDAVRAAIRHANDGDWEKRALIVLTDGGDNTSRARLEDVLRLAQESNVTIYTIGLFDPLSADNSRSVLRKLAGSTGGDVYLPAGADELVPVWDKISQGIRSQYTIGYRPGESSVDGKFHKIRVRVDSAGLDNVRILTRPGYRARTRTK
jgi:Ca-activated chloride channel family protein